MKKSLLSIVLCVAMLVSACVSVSAAAPTPVDTTMDFSLLPDAASDFSTQDGGEGKVTVTKSGSSFVFTADKGWPCAYNTGATTESDKWANVDFTKDTYLNFDFQVKTGAAKVVVYFCGQNPTDQAPTGNYLDLNAYLVETGYELAYGGTQTDVGVGMYQGSINLKDLYVDVDMKTEPFINPDLVVVGDDGREYSYISGFKVFAVSGEVILNDLSVGKAKYGAPAAVVKELNLLTNGSSNGADGESEVTFADGTYTVKVNKGWDAESKQAYGMQIMAGLKDFNLGDTTNLHVKIESDTPWKLTTYDAELDKWIGLADNFGERADVNGTTQKPDGDKFYPAGSYEICVDYGSIYTWNAANGDASFDVTSACIDGIYVEAKNAGTIKVSTLKLSGSNTFSYTAGTYTNEGASNDDVVDKDPATGATTPAGSQGATGGTTTKNQGAAGGNSANTGDISDAALFIVIAAAAAAVVTLSAVSKKAKSR